MEAARVLNFGHVQVNDHLMVTSEMPHGGFKQSGFGKDMSSYSFEEYTQVKHVMIELTGEPEKGWHYTIFGDKPVTTPGIRVGRLCFEWMTWTVSARSGRPRSTMSLAKGTTTTSRCSIRGTASGRIHRSTGSARRCSTASTHLNLYAEDQAAEVKRLIALGATEVHWDRQPPDADFVILADPEGNRFCVIDKG